LANPALATGEPSGIVALDVDGDHGGFDALLQLEQHNAPLPPTQRVRTGSGEHLYFRYPQVHLKNTAGMLGPGLDYPPGIKPDRHASRVRSEADHG
jgi:hypothetical protein